MTAAPEMILKCNKTGKILWSQQEASKHAEETNFQDFSEIAGDLKIWLDKETQRKIFYTLEEVDKFKVRIREPNFEVIETTVLGYRDIL